MGFIIASVTLSIILTLVGYVVYWIRVNALPKFDPRLLDVPKARFRSSEELELCKMWIRYNMVKPGMSTSQYARIMKLFRERNEAIARYLRNQYEINRHPNSMHETIYK